MQICPVIVMPLIFAHLNWAVIPLEEVSLRKAFGGAYLGYCDAVRRWV